MKDKLIQFLRSKMPEAKDLSIIELEKVLKGFSHEIFSFKAEWWEGRRKITRSLIIRMAPEAGIVEPYNVENEYRVLKSLDHTPVPVPKVYWLELDKRVLGNQFFVMEKVEGDIPFLMPPPFNIGGQNPFKNEEQRAKIAKTFVEILAYIHTLDWESLGLSFLGVPKGGTDHIDRKINLYETLLKRARIGPEPLLTEVLVWLKSHKPEAEHISLVHGDFRLGNFVIKNDKIVAFLDWEGASISDPMEDFGWTFMKEFRMDNLSLIDSLMEKDEFLQYYENLTGWNIKEENIDYWEAMAYFNVLARLSNGLAAETAVAVSGMETAKANELIKKIYAKYQDQLSAPPQGKTFPELYNVGKVKPTAEYLAVYERAKEELARLGVPYQS